MSTTTIERCDRCGGRGATTWTKGRVKGRRTLVLCASHDTKYALAMTADNWKATTIEDEVLNPAPEPEPVPA